MKTIYTMKTRARSLKASLITAIALCLFGACHSDKTTFRFYGELTGITQTDFYLFAEGDDFAGFDTLHIKDGRFEYVIQIEKPVLLKLLYPNYAYTYVVAEPGKEVRMEASGSKLGEAIIAGTKENDLLTEFRAQTHALRENEQRMAAAHFVQNNPATLAAVGIFRKFFIETQHFDAEVAEPLLNDLLKAQPEGKEVAELKALLQPLLNSGVGKPLPALQAVSLKKDTIATDSLKGKPCVIGLFATWKNENYQVVPHLTKYETRYKDSINLLGISLDYDSVRCAKRIKQDSLDAPVVCDLKAFQSPMIEALGVRYLPGNILVDHNGIIVRRDVPLKELDKAVEELMNAYRNKK